MKFSLSRMVSLPLLIVLAGFTVLSSCTKTTVETKTVDNYIHDTTIVEPPPGPAFVRFILMIPGVNSLTLFRNADKSGSPFGGVLSSTSQSYIPIADSSAVTIYPDYFINGVEHLDSVTIPGSLAPYSLTTFGVFYVDDGQGTSGIYLKGVSDDAKTTPPPDGQCYVRFINGLMDYPSPIAELYLDRDGNTLPNSVYLEGSVPSPILGGSMSDYALMPSGQHTLYLVTPTGETVDSLAFLFASGGYYTARVQGKRSTLSDRFFIDAE